MRDATPDDEPLLKPGSETSDGVNTAQLKTFLSWLLLFLTGISFVAIAMEAVQFSHDEIMVCCACLDQLLVTPAQPHVDSLSPPLLPCG